MTCGTSYNHQIFQNIFLNINLNNFYLSTHKNQFNIGVFMWFPGRQKLISCIKQTLSSTICVMERCYFRVKISKDQAHELCNQYLIYEKELQLICQYFNFYSHHLLWSDSFYKEILINKISRDQTHELCTLSYPISKVDLSRKELSNNHCSKENFGITRIKAILMEPKKYLILYF